LGAIDQLSESAQKVLAVALLREPFGFCASRDGHAAPAAAVDVQLSQPLSDRIWIPDRDDEAIDSFLYKVVADVFRDDAGEPAGHTLQNRNREALDEGWQHDH